MKEADLCEWCEWFKESELLETVQILRALFSRNELFRETILNVFCDASQDAYGASAHLRREFDDNVVECRLVAGKDRVVRLKAQSICRPELMGALIAAGLAETLAAVVMTKIAKITFWSDSITVLHWFHRTSSNYNAFVGNRVSETHTIMGNLETTLGAITVSWRYVPTGDNPSNDITRELHPVGLYVKHSYTRWSSFTKQPSSGQKRKLTCPWKKTREKRKG